MVGYRDSSDLKCTGLIQIEKGRKKGSEKGGKRKSFGPGKKVRSEVIELLESDLK
jgi:hypothetical protein